MTVLTLLVFRSKMFYLCIEAFNQEVELLIEISSRVLVLLDETMFILKNSILNAHLSDASF